MTANAKQQDAGTGVCQQDVRVGPRAMLARSTRHFVMRSGRLMAGTRGFAMRSRWVRPRPTWPHMSHRVANGGSNG
jgi:hypothetical protein